MLEGPVPGDFTAQFCATISSTRLTTAHGQGKITALSLEAGVSLEAKTPLETEAPLEIGMPLATGTSALMTS